MSPQIPDKDLPVWAEIVATVLTLAFFAVLGYFIGDTIVEH